MMFQNALELSNTKIRPFSRKICLPEGTLPKRVISPLLAKVENQAKICQFPKVHRIHTSALKTKPPRSRIENKVPFRLKKNLDRSVHIRACYGSDGAGDGSEGRFLVLLQYSAGREEVENLADFKQTQNPHKCFGNQTPTAPDKESCAFSIGKGLGVVTVFSGELQQEMHNTSDMKDSKKMSKIENFQKKIRKSIFSKMSKMTSKGPKWPPEGMRGPFGTLRNHF